MRGATTALALVAALVVVAIAPAEADLLLPTRTPVATGQGVGQLRLRSSIARLKKLKLIGGARKGCELAQGQRIAPLKPPLEGFATFYPKDRLVEITLTGGARTAAGIEVGDPAAAAREAYPGAAYDAPGQLKPFAEGFLWIGGRRKPELTLVIDPGSRRVSSIAIPGPSFCE